MTETTASDDLVLFIQREFKATPERVYEAWTDPAILARWFGPEGSTIPECDMDVRPGGHWRALMLHADGRSNEVSGVYLSLDRPDALKLTWAWTQDDGSRGHETEIDLQFIAEGGRTRMRMTQRVFADKGMRDAHEGGWISSFRCLDQVLA